MSHTITTAVSYVLNKYSRSYPSSSLQSTQPPVESEWQHFTNPVMRIVLEIKRSPSGQLASMRLRILWSIHTDANDLDVVQREVVFEDLELLAFSSLSTSQTSAGLQSDQGLPLKAVYREAVVGIRYLHPRLVPPGSQPAYRRFQVAFKAAMDASQFIDAIRSVCPCKANPQPAHINRQSTILAPSLTRTGTAASSLTPARSARLTERQSVASTSVDPRPVSLGQPLENQAMSTAPCSMATSLSSDDSAFVTCSETSYRGDSQVHSSQKNAGFPKCCGRDTAQSSLPNSSQSSASAQSIVVAMPPPPVPQRTTDSGDATTRGTSRTAHTGDDQRSLFLASLSEHPSLYELSRAELETLVGQIIREEGFVNLLESLDSMWRVKGFLGR